MAGDTVIIGIANNPEPVVLDVITIDYPSTPWTDTIHLSHGVNVTIRNCTIVGGSEDCVDCNNNSDTVLVDNVHVKSGGQYCFTLKGGSKNITLRNVVVDGHGQTVDIDLGNWSDQNTKDKTKAVVLDNLTAADGKPVVVRVLWADKPTIIGGNVKLVVYPSWLVAIWRFFRGL